MPSSSLPGTSVVPGPGPIISGSGGAGNNVALLAHISDPADAHPATAIGYAGGPVWADASTNPATTVEAQLDKIIADLAERITAANSGAQKIGVESTTVGTVTNGGGTLYGRLTALQSADNINYAGGVAWADGTTNPATNIDAQLDKIISDLATMDASATAKIGVGVIIDVTHGITYAAGTLGGRLSQLSNSDNHGYDAGGPTWFDGTANPADSVKDTIDNIVGLLVAAPAGVGASGAGRLGTSQRTAWLGGRTNPGAVSIHAALDKIITDLAAVTVADDGAERIGAAPAGDLLTTSVRAQLNELDTLWGKLARANSWTAAQTFNGSTGNTNPALISGQPLTSDRKLLWEIRNRVPVATAVHIRMYNDEGFSNLGFTDNARWNGANWEADDTTIPASQFRLTSSGVLQVDVKNVTTVPWGTSSWDGFATYGYQSLSLGNTVVSGPASIVCTLLAENGRVQFLNTNNVGGSDSNPPSTQGHLNILKAKNITKCWGVVETGNIGGPTVLNGFNIGSVSYSGFSLVVNFASNMANSNYVVAGLAKNATDKFLTFHNEAVGSCRISHFDASSGAQTDLSDLAGGENICFMVVGEQDS